MEGAVGPWYFNGKIPGLFVSQKTVYIIFLHLNLITDTVNLTEDLEAKDFWFNCLKELIDKISLQVLKSAPNDDGKVQERVENFKKSYKNKLELLKNSPFKDSEETLGAAGNTLSVRTLLELNEKFLK